MNKGLASVVFVLLVLLLVGTGAHAQAGLDPGAAPTFGSVDLPAGFLPDPYITTIISGGNLDASTLGLAAECAGFVSSAPDFSIRRSGQSSILRIFYAGFGDTTLIVRDPAGQVTCNDDYEGVDPLVEISSPAEGTYGVWVGSFAPDEFVPGYLMLSELSSGPGAIISTLLRTTTDVTAAIDGVEYFPDLSFLHVTTPVDYPQIPPVGGQHSAILQNCGLYDYPVSNEQAVHSLEHGAVWITYQPDLPASDITRLAEITLQGTHRLLSPYPGIPSPIVVSAWGYQLKLERADDPRLMQFIGQYEQGPTTPELGAPCSGGAGQPLSFAEADSGAIHQWATSASATSQYSDDSWSAGQATGEPDTFDCGDRTTAWASQTSTGRDVLTVMFAEAVIPTSVHIYQSYNPGAITGIELIPADGGPPIEVTNSADPGGIPCPGVLIVDILSAVPLVNGVNIHLDQTITQNWNEIDAVQLIGNPSRQ